MALHGGLPVISEMILLIIILKCVTKPFDVLRHSTKRCVLQSVNTVHPTSKVSGSLLDRLSFIGPMSSSLIKGDPIRNVTYIIIEFPITSVSIVGTRFLNLRTTSRGTGA
jgi:hypothetical protein